MKIRIVQETNHYALIKVPGGDLGHDSLESAMGAMMENCEKLRELGYRPLHYVPRMTAWMCEKRADKVSKAA